MRLEGLGRVYRSSGLGQDGFDWSAFANVLNTAGTTAANIVRAVNAPGIPGIVYPSAAAYPQGVAPPVLPGGGVSAVGSVSTNSLILIGAALLGVVLLTRRSA